MKEILFMLGVLIGALSGAYLHNLDVVRACETYGTYDGYFQKIECGKSADM